MKYLSGKSIKGILFTLPFDFNLNAIINTEYIQEINYNHTAITLHIRRILFESWTKKCLWCNIVVVMNEKCFLQMPSNKFTKSQIRIWQKSCPCCGIVRHSSHTLEGRNCPFHIQNSIKICCNIFKWSNAGKLKKEWSTSIEALDKTIRDLSTISADANKWINYFKIRSIITSLLLSWHNREFLHSWHASWNLYVQK